LELCVHELADPAISFCRYIRAVFTGDFDYSIFDFSKSYTSFVIGKKDIYRILTNELQFNSCAVMWKKVCFLENKFEESLMYAEEWELYSRIISSGFNGKSINNTLFYGRKHPNSNTGEFYKNDNIRTQSNADAIVLALVNLKKKNLVSKEIIRHFIQIALSYKKYNLFNSVINALELPFWEVLKWKWIYLQLPLRLFLFRIYTNLRK
jgi:hypothetical protein